MSMDKATMELLARRAGLAKALTEFPDDVAAAAKQAADVMSKIKPPTAPAGAPGAGLAKGWTEFPDDVAGAPKQAADVMSKIKQPTAPAAEPWPPMKAGR